MFLSEPSQIAKAQPQCKHSVLSLGWWLQAGINTAMCDIKVTVQPHFTTVNDNDSNHGPLSTDSSGADARRNNSHEDCKTHYTKHNVLAEDKT